mmetsp:Transcript_21743/g.51042  ORF Transcript_21743/g.51042 Transcript_21743/m.51042 type:complete len:758 (+) Transcript_21743:158-2431(+)
MVEHDMEQTPRISNREVNTGESSNVPPLELPKPAVNEKNEQADGETDEHANTLHKPLHVGETTASIASTQGATTVTPRFSSEQTPPIVLDQWPTSSNTDENGSAKIPQTISVQKSEAASIRGIANYGQTCFLNSVLQSLASLSAFDVYLDTQIRAHNRVRRSFLAPGLDEHEEDSSLTLTQTLLDGLRFINGKGASQRHWDPRNVLKAVGESNKQFQNFYQQQDAQELLTTLLDVLVEEQDSKHRPSPAEHARPAAVSLSCAVPATVWALSSSFLQLRLPVLPVDETNCNEDDWNNDMGYDVFDDNDTITVASATRELAQKRRHECKQSLSSGSANNASADNSTKPKGCANGTATTSASSTTSTLLPVGEEKKQEGFELNIPRVNSETNMSDMSSSVAMQPSQNLSTTGSVSTMRTRTSQMSTKQQRLPQVRWSMPLCGWMGSTLQCRTCQYVRPIRNVPFVDLSITPTDVGNPYFMAKNNTHSRPCQVEECLSNFTKVERVESVECPMCTKQAHVAKAQDEVDFWQFTLDDATSLQKRKSKQKPGESSELESIKEELDRHLQTLEKWQQIDCDDDSCAKDMAALLSLEDNGKAEPKIMLRQDSNKCLFLTRLPPVLCLHVQRRFYDPQSGRLSKTNQPVLFQEYLNLAPFCAYSFKPRGSESTSDISWAAGKYTPEQQQQGAASQSQRQIFYRLTAVLEHRGGPDSGHYVCYRRSPHGWCYISDQEVRRVSWQTVQQCQAYMLFYENSNILEHSVN